MSLKFFSLDELKNLDGGRVAVAFEQAMARNDLDEHADLQQARHTHSRDNQISCDDRRRHADVCARNVSGPNRESAI